MAAGEAAGTMAPDTDASPTVADFLADQEADRERTRKYKESARRDQILIMTAATLAGDTGTASPKSKAINAVLTAEEVVKELEARGYLD